MGTGLYVREQQVPRVYQYYYSYGLLTDNLGQLFYAASSFGSQHSGIFYATSNTGQPGSFTDHGLVLSTTSANNYNAIDPK